MFFAPYQCFAVQAPSPCWWRGAAHHRSQRIERMALPGQQSLHQPQWPKLKPNLQRRWPQAAPRREHPPHRRFQPQQNLPKRSSPLPSLPPQPLLPPSHSHPPFPVQAFPVQPNLLRRPSPMCLPRQLLPLPQPVPASNLRASPQSLRPHQRHNLQHQRN